MGKKHYRVAYGGAKKGFGTVKGFMNVLAKNKKSLNNKLEERQVNCLQ